MHWVCQHMVPCMLNEGQKAIRIKMTGDVILPVDKDPSLLGRVVTGNDKWYFLYDSHSKRASATKKSPHSPRNFYSATFINTYSLKRVRYTQDVERCHSKFKSFVHECYSVRDPVE
ncbi:hypothetical protein TNCV_2587701 [Trichonephila clavipes]|nr:hypothetical protein TNCV_2587701 [Trichonephila clavipes]